jgi:hypothetical protein
VDKKSSNMKFNLFYGHEVLDLKDTFGVGDFDFGDFDLEPSPSPHMPAKTLLL